MALRGCYACIKYTVLFFNLIFWLAGLMILGLSLWLFFDSSTYVQHVSEPQKFNIGIYILIAVGVGMTTIGIIGCCGSLRESQCLLFLYFFLILIILVVQVVGLVWLFKNKKDLKDMITRSMLETVQKEYGKPGKELRSAAFDTLQRELACCGANSPRDWAESFYNTERKPSDIGILGTHSDSNQYVIPPSCCNIDDKDKCIEVGTFTLNQYFFSDIHMEGCAVKLESYLRNHIWTVGGIVIAIIAIEFFVMFFSFVLCCAVRKVDQFKA